MKKLIILSLSLLSVSCAQASDYGAKILSDGVMFSDLFNSDPKLRVEIEESAEDIKRGIYYEEYYFVADQYYQALLISKYTERCFLKYDNPNDAKQCSASAILDIAVRMEQNGFEHHICDKELGKLNE